MESLECNKSNSIVNEWSSRKCMTFATERTTFFSLIRDYSGEVFRWDNYCAMKTVTLEAVHLRNKTRTMFTLLLNALLTTLTQKFMTLKNPPGRLGIRENTASRSRVLFFFSFGDNFNVTKALTRRQVTSRCEMKEKKEKKITLMTT